MLLASFSEMLGMGALVPLVSQVSSNDGGGNSLVSHLINQLFGWIGVAPSFTNLLLLLGTALVAKSTIAFLAMRYVAISGADVTTRIRSRLLAAIMNARWSYFVDHRPGEVSTMIAGQAGAAGEAFLSVARLRSQRLEGGQDDFARCLGGPRLQPHADPEDGSGSGGHLRPGQGAKKATAG